MTKFYAVRKGRCPGIYLSWSECKEQISGFSGPEYKAFTSIDDANEFINKKMNTSIPIDDGVTVYIDGSYERGIYSYGCVFVDTDTNKPLKVMNGTGSNPDYVKTRNVAGELLAAKTAIVEAYERGYKAVNLYYDYTGIEKWATGEWKTNTDVTRNYKVFMDKYFKLIDVRFIKVLAHSGNKYNELADQLAKEALMGNRNA